MEYCLRRVGRFRTLVTAAGGGGDGTDIFAVGDLTLSGDYVAYESATELGGGRYGCSAAIVIDNLRQDKRTEVFSWDCGLQASSGSGQPSQGPIVGGVLLDSRGFAAWHVTTHPVAPYTGLNAISCPSISLCVAGDTDGNILTSSSPAGGRDAWTVASRGGSGPISCPTTHFCARASGGELLTSTDPTGGASAWNATPVLSCYPCVSIASISCPSASFCVAADAAGDVVTSTDPTGEQSAWGITKIDGTTWIRGVSCPSPSLCVAVDNNANVLTSTNPTGGADAWSAAQVDPDPVSRPALVAISCPSTTLCVAAASDSTGGNLVISTNPTGGASAWTVAHVDDRRDPISIACASTSLCVAFDFVGNVITSTNPAGGAGAWSVTRGPDPAPFYWPGEVTAACPSASLCVEVTGRGRIGSTTNPAAGGFSWSSELVDSPLCAVATPCAAEQVYGYDSGGTRVLDAAPAGSGSALTDLKLRGNTLTWRHNGTPAQATLK